MEAVVAAESCKRSNGPVARKMLRTDRDRLHGEAARRYQHYKLSGAGNPIWTLGAVPKWWPLTKMAASLWDHISVPSLAQGTTRPTIGVARLRELTPQHAGGTPKITGLGAARAQNRLCPTVDDP